MEQFSPKELVGLILEWWDRSGARGTNRLVYNNGLVTNEKNDGQRGTLLHLLGVLTSLTSSNDIRVVDV